MNQEELDNLRYPIGKFSVPDAYTPELRLQYTNSIKNLPAKLREATLGLNDEQLDLPYRDHGWTTRQITHHLADSHINSFMRFKLALTEINPTIKPYDQDAWIKGIDATMPIEVSLSILDGIHARLALLLETMTPEDYNRTLYHPEYQKSLPLDMMAALYGWHSEHHVGQIVALSERKGWK